MARKTIAGCRDFESFMTEWQQSLVRQNKLMRLQWEEHQEEIEHQRQRMLKFLQEV